MAKKLQPVSIGGIKFDALIELTESMNSTIPNYPVEDGFSVADTIINEPLSINLVLYISASPLTFKKNGVGAERVDKVCNDIKRMWEEKKLRKIVTSSCIYTTMGITSITIKKSKDLGYSREVTVAAKKVIVTKRKETKIPKYALKSGSSKKSAGKANTSKTSNAKSTNKTKSKTQASAKTVNTKKQSNTKKAGSMLYKLTH